MKRTYEDCKRILELGEQGKTKMEIFRMTDYSIYTIRTVIVEYGSVAELDKNPPTIGKKRESYTEEEFREAVATSRSIAGVLRKLGVRPAGGNYAVAKQRIAEYGLDTSHFTGKGWAKNKSFDRRGRSIPMSEILVENSTYSSTYDLKRRPLAEGYFEHRCQKCKLDTWLEKPMPLELHHENGDRRDHRLENLRLLCPNCHALTPTYHGKNKGN